MFERLDGLSWSVSREDGVWWLFVGMRIGQMGMTAGLFRLVKSARETLNNCLGLLGEDTGHRFRVVIYGSARLKEQDEAYKKIFRFAGGLIRLGIDVVTGAGPGAMEAGNKGASYKKTLCQSSARSLGVSLLLPFEQGKNTGVEIDYETEDFSLRLDTFGVLACCHVIASKGGIGTLLELLKFVQLHQIQKYQGMNGAKPCLFPAHPSVRLGYVPCIILIGPLYEHFFKLLEEMDREGMLKLSELTFLKRAKTYEEAMTLVRKARKKWRLFLENKGKEPLN